MFHWLPVTPWALAGGLVVMTVAATLQSTIGFGFAVLSVPVLLMIDPQLAPVPQLLCAVPLTLSMAWRERDALDLRGIWWVIGGRLIGALLGLQLLMVASKQLLDVVIALIVLAAVAAIAAVRRVPRTPFTEVAAGTASGVSSLVSSIGGPPLALLYRDASGGTLRSSMAAIFTIGLAITITTRAVAGEISRVDLEVAACLLPAVLLGFWSSRFFLGRVEGGGLKRAILVVASLAAVGLLARAAFAHG